VIGQAWRNNWEYVTPFLSFEPEVRRVIYTTDEIAGRVKSHAEQVTPRTRPQDLSPRSLAGWGASNAASTVT
jgi:transposase-like protein